MSYKILAAAPFMLLAVGCAESGGDGEAATEEAAEAPAALVLTGEEGFQNLVDCHAKLTAVSNLFSAIAETSTGDEQLEMADTASARSMLAFDYKLRADNLAFELGRSPEEVAQAVEAATAAVESEHQTQEFEDFAVWLGAEADKCPPLAV